MDETTAGFTRPTDVDQARVLFGQNIAYLRGFFDIRTVSAHGGTYNYLYESGDYERTKNLEPFGVVSASYLPYTAFAPANYSFISDVDGQLEYLKGALLERQPGDVVQVLIHPFSKRWTVDDFAPLVPSEQPTANPVPATPSPTASSPPTSGPSADSVTRHDELAAITNGSSGVGYGPWLDLLALAPAALFALAFWKYHRTKTKQPTAKIALEQGGEQAPRRLGQAES